MIKIKLIVVLWMFPLVVHGQKTFNSILYVYDTIIIHDTIRIRKPRIVEKLPILFFEKPLEMPPKTATFSTKSIFVSKQLLVSKQKNKMKKNFLWAMMLWTMPDLGAQTHLNATIGGGIHEMRVGEIIGNPNAESYTEYSTTRLTPLATHVQIGLHLFRYGLKKQLVYGIGLDYHYMFSNEYQAFRAGFHLYNKSWNVQNNYSLWSLPMYAQWNTKFAKPLLGMIVDYKRRSTDWQSNSLMICGTSELVFPNAPNTANDLKLSMLAGLEMPISNKYSVRLNYVHQLFVNERWAIRWDEPYSQSDYKVKNYRLELTFVAHLKEF